MPSKSIRVFVSSPFNGFNDDRNTLYAKVFQPLDKLCAENGFSFHAVDLRWGVSDARAVLNKAARICLEEIERCQKESPRPNFIVMTGTRYGWIPMPESISMDHWKLIYDSCDACEREQLKKSYWKDENDCIPKYHFTGNEAGRDVLFQHAKKVLPHREQIFYGASMTEQEIYKGLLDQEGAKEHTVVMIRENDKVGFKKDDDIIVQGVGGLSLQNTLRHAMEGHEENLVVYNKGEMPEYWKPVYERLRSIVVSQMEQVKAEIARKDEAELRREERERRIKEASEEYIDCDNRLEMLRNKIAQSRGKGVVVQGSQGMGKSLLLKKYVHETKATAIFSDLDAECMNIMQAIRKLMAGFDNMPTMVPGTGLAHWFQDCLKRIDQPTVLVIDSIDEIQDYAGFYGSLWNMKIPKDIVVVLGCVDYGKYGDPTKVECLTLPGLDRDSAISLLMEMLKRAGRTLTHKQISDLKMPNNVEALYVFAMYQRLRTLASYEEIDDEAMTLQKLLEHAYNEKKRYYDNVFTSHALACIALSSHGLQEKELIGIMGEDNNVIAQIQQEDQTRIKGIEQRYHSLEQPIMNKWASLFHGSDDFLVSVIENDITLIKCRHGLIRDICGNIPGVVDTMISYFDKQPDYYGSVINRRKIDELVPLLKKADDKDKARVYLTNPIVQNAWIMLGKYDSLMDDLEWIEFEQIALSQHPMLYREELRSFPHVFNRHNGDVFDCAYLKCEDNDLMYRRLPVTGSYALKNDGLIAIATGEQILLYDWERNRIVHSVDIEANVRVFYWDGDDLVLRGETERLRFSYKEHQLKLKEREECQNVLDLYAYDDFEKITKAGGFAETCWGLKSDDYYLMWRNGDAFERIELLYYGHDILHICRNEFACVIIDRVLIHVIHLKERKIWMTIQGLQPLECLFSPDCKRLLVISNDNGMHMVEIEKQMEQEMVSTVFSRKDLRRAFFGRVFRNIQRVIGMATSLYEHKQFPYNPNEIAGKWNVHGRKTPLLYCYDHKYQWYAAYYYDNSVAYVRVFDANANCLMLESVVDPILTVDLDGDPFLADGTLLKIVSDGKTQVLDVWEGTWSSEVKERENYRTFRRQRSLVMLPRDRDKVIKRGIAIASIVGPALFVPLAQMVYGTEKGILQHVVKKTDGEYVWHININLGRIIITDQKGDGVLIDEVEHALIAADVKDGKAYLLREAGAKPIVYELINARQRSTE